MSEYLEKQEAATIPVLPKEHRKYQTANLDDAYENGWYDALECVEKLPPADVRPVVRGKWVSDEDTYPGPGMRNYKCSACGEIAGTWRKGLKKEQLYPFCPNCGADMMEDKP